MVGLVDMAGSFEAEPGPLSGLQSAGRLSQYIPPSVWVAKCPRRVQFVSRGQVGRKYATE